MAHVRCLRKLTRILTGDAWDAACYPARMARKLIYERLETRTLLPHCQGEGHQRPLQALSQGEGGPRSLQSFDQGQRGKSTIPAFFKRQDETEALPGL
jgi:hypothetical protein